MAYRLLRREGWRVKRKRVQWLWREEGLQRPDDESGHGPPIALCGQRAEHPQQVWAIDFQAGHSKLTAAYSNS